MDEERKGQDLDNAALQDILNQADQQTDFPEVPFDEFTPPTYEEWKEACIALLKGAPFEKKMYTKTYEGITFEPMYTRAMTEDILPKGSFPGMEDFLRGTRPDGYIQHPWGIAQACDETLPEENNALLRHEAEKGSTIYNIRLDEASRENIDVSEAAALGTQGCNIATLADMDQLLAGLKLDVHGLYIYAGASPLPVLAMVAADFRASGKKMGKLHGIIGGDPLGELLAAGKNYAPVHQLYDELAACGKWAAEHAPGLRTVAVRSDVFSRGGSSDVQEIAYTLAKGVEYLRALLERGLTIEQAAGQMAFSFSMGANFFMQIAKLRAVRPLWAKIVGAFGGSEKAQRMVVHGKPALFFKTVYDPYVNMLRNTTEIFSGVVGGVDSYENAPFDEPIRKGDEFSRRIARNVQIILQEEFGLLKPIDPAGGSWAVESLTRQMKEKIWAEFQRIEGQGGLLTAMLAADPQTHIEGILQERFKNAELRRDRIVGNNMYPNMTEKRLDPRPEDQTELREKRRAAVEAYEADLDEPFREEALQALARAPWTERLEKSLAAALAGASLGALRRALNAGTADVSEIVTPILPHRWSEHYEALRERTEAYKERTGKNLRVFLANMGPVPQHKARADFTSSFLQVGAFEILGNNGFPDPASAAAAAGESGADAVVICSTDAAYPEIVPVLAPLLHQALPDAVVYLAGAAPKDLEPGYRAAGIDDFISVRANCYKILQFLQEKKGMME